MPNRGPTARCLANGDATFMADHWDRCTPTSPRNAGGDVKLWRKGATPPTPPGYLIDKEDRRRAPDHQHRAQLQDPHRPVVRHQRRRQGRPHRLHAGLGLRGTIGTSSRLRPARAVTHVQGTARLMADTIAPLSGQPAGAVPAPGRRSGSAPSCARAKDVVCCECRSPPCPATRPAENRLAADGRNYGFPLDTQKIVANKAFAERTRPPPGCSKVMQLPWPTSTRRTTAAEERQKQSADIERHVDGWDPRAPEDLLTAGWTAQGSRAVSLRINGFQRLMYQAPVAIF